MTETIRSALGREVIDKLKGATLARVDAKIEGMGESLYLQEMTGAERYAWSEWFSGAKAAASGKNPTLFRERLIATCLRDGQGTRIIGDEQAAEIQHWPFLVIEKLAEMALKVNGMGEEEDTQKKSETPAS